MPAIASMQDDVTTADEALRRAAMVRENRRRSYLPRPKPPLEIVQSIPIAEEKIPPSTVPLGPPPHYWHKVRVIQRVVCHKYGFTIEDMLRDRRTVCYVTPRFIAMYLAREILGAGWCTLGSRFNRDHTSIIHGVRKLKSQMFDDHALVSEVEELKRQCVDQLSQREQQRAARESHSEELA